MPRITDVTSKRRWPACVTAGVMVTAFLALGTFTAASASAEERRGDRQWEHRDYHHRDWNGGYYRSPPVIYDRPYYSPPVVYGPGLGLNFNFR